MRIEQTSDIITIRFASRQFRETAKVLGIALLIFPGLLLLWIGGNFPVSTSFWTYIILLYAAYFVGLFFFASMEKKLEIHPERLYSRDWFLEPEYEYPITDKMVIMLENFPRIQWVIPREFWRISIGYPDGVYQLLEEMDDHVTMRRLAHFLAKKFKAPLIDYTYADQLDMVFFYSPDEVDMPFAERAVKYPDMLAFGDLPTYKAINEDIVAHDKRVYQWSAFSWDVLLRNGVIAVIAVILVLLNVISANSDAFVPVPVISNAVLYYLIIFWFLGQLVYSTGVRNKLTLTREKITYLSTIYKFTRVNKTLTTASIQEVRVKPAPGGFVTMIIGKDDSIDVRTHLGGIEDFGHLLWLTGRIQDFILENRMAFILEKHQEQQKPVEEEEEPDCEEAEDEEPAGEKSAEDETGEVNQELPDIKESFQENSETRPESS